MKLFALAVMIGWIPFVIYLFSRGNPRRAVINAYVIAWLFLPLANYQIPGLPDYTKVTATSGGVLLAVLMFDPQRLFSFRPRWFDLPMMAWCFCPFISSMANGLGPYDGLSEVVNQTVMWGLPYLFGRLYLSDLEGLRELALVIVIGGLLYVPFCLFEMRMSPQLHTWIYGRAKTQDFTIAVRFGGYRPMVFMQTGLTLGLWMAAASLSGYWLWASGAVTKLGRYPFGPILFGLFVVTVLCKSSGALLLLMIGMALYQVVKYTRSPLPLLALLLVPPVYVGARVSRTWEAKEVVDAMTAMFGPDRAQSLQFRIDNEKLLLDRALEQPLFGWGGWGRSSVALDADLQWEEYTKYAITDSLWIIAIGTTGLFGLTSLGLTFFVPPWLLIRRFPARYWRDPALVPATIMAVLVSLYGLDNLLNNMLNPVYILAIGGLSAAIDSVRK